MLVLEGIIDEAMARRFHEAVGARTITSVRITSSGSNARRTPRRNIPALLIAREIRARGIDVTVSGLCADSCANYIFVAARNRSVEPDSLVVFGPSVTTLAAIEQTIGDFFPTDFEAMFRGFRELANAEQYLFGLPGVSPALLMDSSIARQPLCVVFNREGTSPHSISVNMTYNGWVPSRSYMIAAGMPFEGYWPASRREMMQVGRKVLDPDTSRVTRFANEDHLRGRTKGHYRPQDLKDCVLEQVSAEGTQD